MTGPLTFPLVFDGVPFIAQGASVPCAETDPELFFPDPGGAGVETAKAAMRICAGCAEKAECLQWALDNNEYGVWGGTTDSMRDVIKTNLRRLT